MKQTVILLVFAKLLFTSNCLFAQEDIPVDYQRGTPLISIPIAELKDKGINVPISLAYNGSGVKVSSSEAGNDLVGINWSLNAGGIISRRVNGLPDDYSMQTSSKIGWLKNNNRKYIGDYIFSADNTMSTCLDEQTDWNLLNSDLNNKDTEPDEFSISVPGLSCRFFFDNDGIIRTYPYQDLRISYNLSSNGNFIESFEVTSTDGTKYVFNKIARAVMLADILQGNEEDIVIYRRQYDLYKSENLNNFYDPGLEYVISWGLTKIISPAGGDISFEYYAPKPIVAYNTSSSKYEILSPTVNPVSFTQGDMTEKKLYILLYKEQELRLKSILSSSGKRVDFTIYKNNSSITNLNALDEAYTSISVSDTVDNILKQTKNYELAYYVTSDPQNEVRRAFLKSIQETTDCYKFPPFKFEYFAVDSLSTNLPKSTINAQDYFGYFNGAGATDLVAPNIFYRHTSSNDPVYFSLYTSYLANTGNLPAYNGTSNSRYVNPSLINSGTMSKITYPPGGYVTFEYEPNDYYHTTDNVHFNSQNTYGEGIRIKKVTSHDNIDEASNIVKEYVYTLADGVTSSGTVNYPYQFAVDAGNLLLSKFNLFPDVELRYQRTTLKINGKKSAVFEYGMPPMFPTTSLTGWDATVIKPIRFADDNVCETGIYNSSYRYGYPFVQNTNLDYDEGLLNVRYDYNGDGDLIKKTNYEYQRITPGAVNIKAFKFDNMYNNFLVGEYHILANVKRVLKKESVTIINPANPTANLETFTTHYYESPNHQYLSKILTQNSNGEIYENMFSYVKDFAITNPTSDQASIALKNMYEAHIYTPIVEEYSAVTRNSVKKITGASLTKYKTVGTIPGLPSEKLSLPIITATFVPAYLQAISSDKEFKHDPNYISTTKYLKYDDKGNLLDINDGKKNNKAYIFGYNKRHLVAEIVNAKSDEVAFSDFETITDQSFDGELLDSYSQIIFSGEKSLFVYTNNYLRKTINKGLGKFYRLSAYINTAEISGGLDGGQINILLSDGTNTVNASLPTNTVVGEWTFYEKLIDVSVLNSPFTIEIRSPDDLIYDNLAFYPASANIYSYTYKFPYGKSSEADASGSIVHYEYDDLGRIKFVKDRNKDIIKQTDYKYNHDLPVAFNADIKEYLNSNVEGYLENTVGKVNVGDNWHFSSKNNCISEIAHQWYVNDVLKSTAASFAYTFPSTGIYTIKHIVSHPILGTKAVEIEKEAVLIPLKISLSVNGPHQLTLCDFQNQQIDKTFTANVSSGSSNGSLTYNWSYVRQNSTAINIIVLAGGGINDNYITIRYPYGYFVNCVANNIVQEPATEGITITYNAQECEVGQ